MSHGSQPVYDCLGETYSATRRPDARIAALIEDALRDARSVVNVGAGTGAYEPKSTALAVEPSSVMIRQRPRDAAPAIQAEAEELPLADDSFDAALAVLTVHHWADQARGLAELRRVARRRVVVLSFDPAAMSRFWLSDYLPSLVPIDEKRFPPLDVQAARLGGADVAPVPIPADCTDGFLAAYWRRPAAYLDPAVRANISTFALLGEEETRTGLSRLRSELADGTWRRRWGHLLALDELDAGYRLLAAEL